jgi:arsenate reductase-like glutaredoxin family protein
MSGVNIIVYGTPKCRETQKALRFFKERRVQVQFRDLTEKPLSEGELKNISAGKEPASLLDESSSAYAKRGLKYMDFDPAEEILADNALLLTPIIRVDGKSYARPDLAALPLK